MDNLSKIIEGGIEYTIGKLKGSEMKYDFDKILIYLDAKGKMLYGKQFQIHEDDRDIIYQLSNYFIRDKEKCEKSGMDPEKGILLSGPVGCGKTSLMKLLPYIVPLQRPYLTMPSRNIVFAFNHLGYKIIDDYGNGGFFCFDDMGVEPIGRHYGQDCNVMGEILLSRYELFLKSKIRTHATTNLNATELEGLYGNRVRSRMREMFNLIAFEKDVKDKRK